MSFLNLDLTNVQEFTTVKPDEYKLRILKAEIKTSQNTGGQYISLLLDIPEIPLSKNINHTLMIPTASDDIKQANARKLGIINFLKAFGFDPGAPMETEQLVGAQGWALLDEKEEGDYGLQNRVKRFIVPKS
jgi:hypothetical protein